VWNAPPRCVTVFAKRSDAPGAAGAQKLRTTSNRAASQAGINTVLGRVILMETHFATLIALLSMLLARVGVTHLTIPEAAALRKHMTGRGSVAGIRKLIARGQLTLEVIPGTRTSGIPIEQVYPQWLPIAAARAAFEREHAKREGQIDAQS
jgi:hypothetical protein